MALLSLVLTLKPLQTAATPTLPPAWWGRAAHALLLHTVREVDENLAAELHTPPGEVEEHASASSNQVRPFTASTLMGRFNKGTPEPQSTYTLRLTAFRDDLAAILEQSSQSGTLSPGRTIGLDYLPFEIMPNPTLAPIANSISAIQKSSYQDISSPYLLAKQPAPRRLTLQFTSPTTFKSAGKHLPIPLPALVFGSLLERWNAYSPISFPVEVRRYAEECLAISQFALETRPVPQKNRGLRVGAVGRISYTALNYDRYWMSVLAVLAEFSLFCGVGVGTSQGLGQARRIED